MRTLFKKYFILLPLLFFLFTACSVEDAVGDVINGNAVTAKINGKDFGAPKELVSAKIQLISNVYVISIGAGDADGINLIKGIILATSGLDFDTLKAGKTWSSVSTDPNNIAEAGYTEDDRNNEVNDFETEITEDIFIKITAIDKEKKLISGEFNFVVVDEDTNKKYTATNGKFTDIPYLLE